MKGNGLLICLVFMWISSAVGTHNNEYAMGIQQRKRACRNLGGRCINRKRDCPGNFPTETSPGKPFCKRRRRCCYPAPTTFEPTTYPEYTGPTVDPSETTVLCGADTLSSTRIVGGNTVKEIRKYSWQVGIKYVEDPSAKFICGGTIISEKHILTAAHCFYNNPDSVDCTLRVPTYFYVGYDSNMRDKATLKRVPKVNVKTHDFECLTKENDIAIITLPEPLDFQKGAIRPVCLPKNDDNMYAGSDATVIGWGGIKGFNPSEPLSEPQVFPNDLKEADVPVISNTACKNVYGSKITPNMLCTSTGEGFDGKPKGNGHCHADSGGPLVVKGTVQGKKRYIQIGIVSWVFGCDAKGYPAGFVRISKFLDWIKQRVGVEKTYHLT